MMSKEFEWLSRHHEKEIKYRGEYIAVVGEKIVAHGRNFRKVAAEAEKTSRDPLYAKVPIEEVMIL